MKILIACEYSGRVRDAFTKKGHYAMSCDILPTESEGPHYQGDVLDVLNDGWDMMIAHPPCTYLASSGLHWNKKRPKALKTKQLWSLLQHESSIKSSFGKSGGLHQHTTQVMPKPQYVHSICLEMM